MSKLKHFFPTNYAKNTFKEWKMFSSSFQAYYELTEKAAKNKEVHCSYQTSTAVSKVYYAC